VSQATDKSAVDGGAPFGGGKGRVSAVFDSGSTAANETNKVGLGQGGLRYGDCGGGLTAGVQPRVLSRTVDWRCAGGIPHAGSLPNCHFLHSRQSRPLGVRWNCRQSVDRHNASPEEA